MYITYNGIAFTIVKVNRLDYEPVYSPDRATYLYTKVTLDVDGIMNPQAMAYVSVVGPLATPGALPATTIAAIHHALTTPRGQLLFTCPTGVPGLATTVLQSPAPNYTVDCNNGPLPQRCTVREFAGARTWTINWVCETWVHDCPTEAGARSDALISLRYSQSDSFDVQRRSTRTTTGQALFRTDILEALQTTVDTFRAQCLPPTPLGYFRTHVNVTVVPNRNALHFTCTDEERMYDLGDTNATQSYITEVDAGFGMTSIVTDKGIPGGQTLGTFHATVKGDKRASTWVMIQRTWQLAAAVLPFGDAAQGYIQNVSMHKSYTDRAITLTIGYRFNAVDGGPFGEIPVNFLRIDSIFAADGTGVNPDPPWGKGSRGTSNLHLLVTALESACTGAATPAVGDASTLLPAGVQAGPYPAVSVAPADELPTIPNKYSDGATTAPYNDYQVTTYYQNEPGLTSAPVASASADDPDTVFFQLNLPQTRIKVEWTAERIGANPTIPSPNNNDANLVLLRWDVTPEAPPVLADGNTGAFRCTGWYEYGCKTAMQTGDGFISGALPWIAAQFVPIPYNLGNDAQHGIVDAADTGGAMFGPGVA